MIETKIESDSPGYAFMFLIHIKSRFFLKRKKKKNPWVGTRKTWDGDFYNDDNILLREIKQQKFLLFNLEFCLWLLDAMAHKKHNVPDWFFFV